MCDHMANSKAYVSFVLLFTSLLSSHVLSHELPEGGIGTKSDQYTTHLLGNGKGGIGPNRNQYMSRLLGNGIGGTGAERDQYAHSVDYQHPGLEDIELKNYKDGTVMSHRKMMRPSEIDWKSSHESQAKTSSMAHGSKSGYDGVPKMEEVGDEGKMN